MSVKTPLPLKLEFFKRVFHVLPREHRVPSGDRYYPESSTKCDAGTRIQGDHPFNDQPFRLPFKLYFACEKTKWGPGGVAFVAIEPVTPPPTLGRAYLLTLPQLRCIARGYIPVNITNETPRKDDQETHHPSVTVTQFGRVYTRLTRTN